MTSVITLFIFCLGALTGSFLNVVGLRLLREESIVWPNSYCYGCKAKIKPYDNIPLLSWLMLKGRCRACKAFIHWQYPAIELLTGILFVALVYQYGFGLQTGFLLLLACNLIVVLITDFREHYIFDVNSWGLIPFGLAYTFFNLAHVPGSMTLPWVGWTVPWIFISALIAMVGAFLIFLGLNLFSLLLVGKPGFGEGDTRLLMGIGSFLGWQGMVIVFILSFVIQAVVGIPLLIRQWVLQGAYKTAALLACAMGLAGFPYLCQHFITNGNMLLGLALVCGVLAMICAMKALKSAKELPMGLTYLPFGPAIVFATFIMLFFQSTVMHFLHWG